jgi:hypothetical protein
MREKQASIGDDAWIEDHGDSCGRRRRSHPNRHVCTLAPRADAHQHRAMDPNAARVLADRLHADDREPGGALRLAHIRRVAFATSPDARAVAWLHEALETAAVCEQELLEAGLTSDQLRALRLLTVPAPARSDAVYLARIELIARAAGHSGELARAVKIADLRDRHAHSAARPDGWSPPYARALGLLLTACREEASAVDARLRVTS